MIKRYPKSFALVIIIAVCLLFLLLLGAGNHYTLSVTLNGEDDITVEYGERYQDPGAAACFFGSLLHRTPVEVEVDITGEVDARQLGVYTICYTGEYKGVVGTAYRRVQVVDTRKPVIQLTADPQGYTLPGHTYQEEGYSAWDNYDGDITHKVVRTELDGCVVYRVEDSQGNATYAVRTIHYADPIPPEITLKGPAEVEIYAGDTYVEPGYTAADNCDGDITQQVTVSSDPISTMFPGTVYTVSYTVSDAAGNITTVTRTLRVIPRPLPETVKPNGKVIYLTFDDGPSPYTQTLLNVLKKYNIKATFFVTDTGRTQTLRKIAQDGHTIGIHSATHNYQTIYASEEAYFQDLYRMRQIIYDCTGQNPTLIRFPGGSSNRVSSFNPGIMTRLTKLVQDHGFRYFDWNVSSGDAGNVYTTDAVYNNVIAGIKQRNISVVLQHDIYKFSVDAVENIIRWGLENGYTFLPLTQESPDCHHAIKN